MKYLINHIGHAHFPCLQVMMLRENNQLYYTAISNNVFTTLFIHSKPGLFQAEHFRPKSC